MWPQVCEHVSLQGEKNTFPWSAQKWVLFVFLGFFFCLERYQKIWSRTKISFEWSFESFGDVDHSVAIALQLGTFEHNHERIQLLAPPSIFTALWNKKERNVITKKSQLCYLPTSAYLRMTRPLLCFRWAVFQPEMFPETSGVGETHWDLLKVKVHFSLRVSEHFSLKRLMFFI